MTTLNSGAEQFWQVSLPLPIKTDRLLMRPCREGDGTTLAEAIGKNWTLFIPGSMAACAL
ncbi:MAG: hypothetical protein NXH97_16665 [Rhodobacteraceae bacterium]|nr:hypothetical protein [Paracoccaceae bacterium]